MSSSERIIQQFGGITALARALGHKHPTTVQGWKVRGLIPAKQQRKVLEAARTLGVAITPADFIDGEAA